MYVLQPDSTVKYTEIQISNLNDGKNYIVLDGLKSGDKIAVEGVTRLNDGMKITPITAAQKEAKALDEENFVFSNRAQDLLHRAIENLNADGRYKLIVNANALLDADSTLDITPAVLQEVNRLYALEKKDKDKK